MSVHPVHPVINTDYSVVNSVINGCKSTVLNGYHSITELLPCVKSFFGGDAPTHYPLASLKSVEQHEVTTQVVSAVSSENVTQSEVKKSAKEMPSRIANLVQPILELLNRYKLEIVVGAIVLYCDSVGVDGASILGDEFSTENITDLSTLTNFINGTVTESPELFNGTTLAPANETTLAFANATTLAPANATEYSLIDVILNGFNGLSKKLRFGLLVSGGILSIYFVVSVIVLICCCCKSKTKSTHTPYLSGRGESSSDA